MYSTNRRSFHADVRFISFHLVSAGNWILVVSHIQTQIIYDAKQNVFLFFVLFYVVGRLYVALFFALEQTHCVFVACDFE